MEQAFVPLLFGGDINVYSMGRAFHEAYGIKAVAYGFYQSGPCCGSSILDYRDCPDNDKPEVLLQNVRQVAAEFPDKKILVLGCGDNYLNAITQNLPHYPQNVIAPYVNHELLSTLIHKARFYELCEQYGVDYPDTVVCHKGMGHEFTLPFQGPFVVKPAESDTYWKHPFPTQKKAYVLKTRAEVDRVIDQIYDAGYENEIIIQDFIPGDDSYMRVVTSYSDEAGKVALMCVGHVLLEEHTDHAIGNHAVIITEHEPALCEKLKELLERLSFTGFSNFDVKYDRRDGKFKVFELNCRQGRSNYYVTATGHNLAKCLVEDRVEHKPHSLTLVDKPHLWMVVPRSVAFDYISKDYHDRMRTLIKENKVVNPLFYGKDRGVVHKLRILNNHRRYYGWYRSVMEKVR